MKDTNIEQLHDLAERYRKAKLAQAQAKRELWNYVRELKNQGYSYPALTKESGLARGTIQNIIRDYPYKK